MCNCDPLPHDEEMCRASKNVRAWFRSEIVRMTTVVDMTKKKPQNANRANSPVLSKTRAKGQTLELDLKRKERQS